MEADVAKTECWLLDVGQGTSNVILLGEKRAIVIDCGPKNSNTVLNLLKRYVDVIEALIISHNDEDHDGGVANIIQAYPKAIFKVFFLADRPAKHIRTFRLSMREFKAGNLLEPPERLEAKTHPQVLYEDKTKAIKLELFYPDFTDNLSAEESVAIRANRTSGILGLFCGKRKVLFSGDATIEAWESFGSKFSRQKPLACDVMTIPHHGGHISDTISEETRCLSRLYTKIIKPRYGAISVGSSNTYGHPANSTIAALKSLGIEVLCTQMTPQCCEDLEAIRPGLVKPTWPSQSDNVVRKTQSGRSKNVGCAGSIVVDISENLVNVSISPHHQKAIEQLFDTDPRNFHPLCRAS